MDADGPTESPTPVPARMLNEFVYCPRLFYLEWVQGEFRDNEEVLSGHLVHRRVEKESGKLPAPAPEGQALEYKARGVTLQSERLGLVAKLDLLEGEGGKRSRSITSEAILHGTPGECGQRTGCRWGPRRSSFARTVTPVRTGSSTTPRPDSESGYPSPLSSRGR
jgi:hypothetical protein